MLVTRETPLSLIHLRNMTTVTEAAATVVPPVPSLYTRPETVDEILDQTVGRCLDLLNVHLDRPGVVAALLADWARQVHPAG